MSHISVSTNNTGHYIDLHTLIDLNIYQLGSSWFRLGLDKPKIFFELSIQVLGPRQSERSVKADGLQKWTVCESGPTLTQPSTFRAVHFQIGFCWVTTSFSGNIDVGDGCWRRNVLMTTIRCSWRFRPFWSPISTIILHWHQYPKYVTNIEILSTTSLNRIER